MDHCCVIGGTGFIGSRLVEYLSKTGRKLTIIARNSVPTRHLPTGVRYIAGDYGDKYFLKGVLQGVDEIINLAHTTVPKTSFDDPISDISSNLPAVVSLLEIASQIAIKKLIFISSGGTVYGKSLHPPISETHPTNPISPYGITKLALEKYALMYHEIYGLPVVCIRPANAYGEGQIPYVGQGFISTAIASILQNKDILLFGEHGTTRDYIHVDDVVKTVGMVSAITSEVASAKPTLMFWKHYLRLPLKVVLRSR
jgi:UDP-glucose 4-epimerase